MIRHTRATPAAPSALLLVLTGLLAPASAEAGEKAECDVLEIKASNGGGGLDPGLKRLAKKFKKPPFSSWKTFELLGKHDENLPRMRALALKLKPGGKLSLLFRDLTREPGKKPRLRLSFTLDDKKGKRKLDGTIHLDSGDHYLIGGDPLDGGGTYILAISCKAP